MEYLQYNKVIKPNTHTNSFKPYYKWNTFNTIIKDISFCTSYLSFKPYYKWNTFNTLEDDGMYVLAALRF